MRQTGRSDLAPVILDQAQGEIPDEFLDASKASEQLGWLPSFSLADGSGPNPRLVPRAALRAKLQSPSSLGSLSWNRSRSATSVASLLGPGIGMNCLRGTCPETSFNAASHSTRSGGRCVAFTFRKPL